MAFHGEDQKHPDSARLVSSATQQYRGAYRQMAANPLDHWDFVATPSGGMLGRREHAKGRTPLVMNVQRLTEQAFLYTLEVRMQRARVLEAQWAIPEWKACVATQFTSAFDRIFKGDL